MDTTIDVVVEELCNNTVPNTPIIRPANGFETTLFDEKASPKHEGMQFQYFSKKTPEILRKTAPKKTFDKCPRKTSVTKSIKVNFCVNYNRSPPWMLFWGFSEFFRITILQNCSFSVSNYSIFFIDCFSETVNGFYPLKNFAKRPT